MRKVQRSDVLDFQTYVDRRDAYRARVLQEKAKRRIHLGEHLTFLFESTDTILYQVQEMMRIEQIVREKEIQHEIDTYNQLLGGPGELGCTLQIEIDDAAERNVKLRAWLRLPQHLYLKLDDASRVPALWDSAQMDDTRLSTVQYLKFQVGPRRPVAIGSTLPELQLEAELTAEQQQTLTADLES
jgi:hypothetical protein